MTPSFRVFERLSPNISSAGINECYGVLFHHSVMPFAATIELMADPASEVSYHCLIDGDGTRCTMAMDTAIAWHAGASNFHGRSRCNDFMVGVAFAGSTYEHPLTHEQLASAKEWWEVRRRLHHWTIDRISDHRQVSPGRKDDLNPREWERLIAFLSS